MSVYMENKDSVSVHGDQNKCTWRPGIVSVYMDSRYSVAVHGDQGQCQCIWRPGSVYMYVHVHEDQV